MRLNRARALAQDQERGREGSSDQGSSEYAQSQGCLNVWMELVGELVQGTTMICISSDIPRELEATNNTGRLLCVRG